VFDRPRPAHRQEVFRGDPARAATPRTANRGRSSEPALLAADAAEPSARRAMVGECLATIRYPPGNCPFEARGQVQDRRQARPPVFVRKRRSNWQAPMMDGVDQILRDFEETVAAASAEAISRLRAISARQPAALPAETMRTPPTDLISAARAGKLARRSKQTIARWCAEHPWDTPAVSPSACAAGGLSQRPPLLNFFRSVRRGEMFERKNRCQ
jgi:hypothetical protein